MLTKLFRWLTLFSNTLESATSFISVISSKILVDELEYTDEVATTLDTFTDAIPISLEDEFTIRLLSNDDVGVLASSLSSQYDNDNDDKAQ